MVKHGDFDDRLRKARAQQGLDPDPEKGKGGLPAGVWGLGLRIGAELVSASEPEKGTVDAYGELAPQTVRLLVWKNVK